MSGSHGWDQVTRSADSHSAGLRLRLFRVRGVTYGTTGGRRAVPRGCEGRHASSKTLPLEST